MSRVVVCGSLNMDVVVQSTRRPATGETILGATVSFLPGGKGLNQAVAAARLGVPTAMIGAVGNDAFANNLRGFKYRDVGPKDDTGEPLGGDTAWYGTVELNFPIFGERDEPKLRGAVFYDVGKVHSPKREAPVKLIRIEGQNLDHVRRSNIEAR